MSNKIKSFMLIALGVACLLSLNEFRLVLEADYIKYKHESECVARHIANGVERINILTTRGTCYVIRGE